MMAQVIRFLLPFRDLATADLAVADIWGIESVHGSSFSVFLLPCLYLTI